jgi:YggT family protein
VVLIRILLTWFRPSPEAPLMRFLSKLADPALNFARRRFPVRLGGLDFSPVILLILLSLAAFFVQTSMTWLGHGGPAAGLLGILALAPVQAIRSLNWLFILLLIGRVFISLVNPSPYNPLVMVVMALTQPLVAPLRGTVPSKGPGGLDLGAALVCVGLIILHTVVLANLGPPIEGWMIGLLRQGPPPLIPTGPPPGEPRIW